MANILSCSCCYLIVNEMSRKFSCTLAVEKYVAIPG